MLSDLKLLNFQVHSYLVIDLDSHITTIIGRTDVGKSAILRALRWLCTNSPQGSAFIQHGQFECSVLLIVDDRIIIRSKGQHNEYLLDVEAFRSFSSDVPEPIAKVLNVGDVNFQLQFDGPFWFNLSAGEVSRRLNSIVDLGIIDYALSNVSKKVRHFQVAVQVGQERLQEAKKKREELEWVVEADIEYARVEESLIEYDSVKDRRQLLGTALLEIGIADNERSYCEQMLGDLLMIGRAAQIVVRLQEKRTMLSYLIESIEDFRKTVGTIAPDFEPIRQAYERYEKVWRKRMLLRAMLIAIDEMQKDLDEASQKAEDAEELVTRNLDGQCPLCGALVEWKHDCE